MIDVLIRRGENAQTYRGMNLRDHGGRDGVMKQNTQESLEPLDLGRGKERLCVEKSE